MLRIAWRAATVAAVVIALTGTAEAYSRKDARYVTSSRNKAVLDYIVCLEKAVGAKPKDLPEALAKAEKLCADAAQELPRSPDHPTPKTFVCRSWNAGSSLKIPALIPAADPNDT